MQPEGDDLNPYAAPQSDVAPLKVPEPYLPRPASTGCLLGLMWLIIAGVGILLITEYQSEGPAFLSRFKSLRSALSSSLMVIILIAFHAFKRSRITYMLGVLYLLFISVILWNQVSETVRNFVSKWNQQADTPQSNADLFVALIFVALLAKLCYQFIFGLPSRRFYRLTQK